MQTKTVGVIIPIYNVEKYLKECLDSVINQSYTNLEIILVNDGSTDKNSFNIAKEYTLKDKRITLFDKKNGGLSSARNVGIEYFSGEYKLKNKTQTIKENSLIEFNLEGNNPYEIYTVYKSHKAFNNEKDLINFTYPNIDYIIFLDSDDYWELNCIEECVPRMDGVEVVWFDYEMLYDGIKKPMVPEKRSMEFYRFNHSLKISSKNFLNNMVYVSFNSLWFGWHGMIDFRYLKSIKLKFLNQVLHEDHYFGKLLFVQSKYIYVLSKKLIHYRIRQNSIMNYDNSNNSYIPEYMLDEYNALGGNYVLYKKYHRHSSLFLTAMMVLVFLEENDFSNKKIFKKIFVKKLENWITDLANLNNTYLDKIIYFSFKRFVQLYKNHSKIQNESKCYELFFKLGYKIVQQQVILNSINGKNQIMQTKTVGVIIPIYNVEKYLKECLDSVINQSYTNLEIILVNDGSTDKNSFNIAKEYTLKDKRITLFDKKNGGQSTARNVGIEYFSGEYKLKNKTQTIKENSLIEFNLEGNNPYEIYTVYKSHKAFNNEKDLINFTYPNIDYIIFLDSDDYWELNCIEECVPRMDGVEVVWFDFQMFVDKEYKNIYNPNWNRMAKFNFDHNQKITKNYWLDKMIKLQIKDFAFVCDGMIDFKYLKSIKLKFHGFGYGEDHYFGLVCFLKLNNIYIIKQKLHNYRVRGNSSCNFDKKITKESIPAYCLHFYDLFNQDASLAKQYIKIFSICRLIHNYIDIQNELSDEKIKYLLNQIIEYKIATNEFFAYIFYQDPLQVRTIMNENLNYLISKNKDIAVKAKEHIIFFQDKYGTAKQRIQNQLSYKLGQVMIVNSKSLLGCLTMPIVLLIMVISHKQEQKIYQEKIKKDPFLKLPSLESYPDYGEAIKLKSHLSYRLGQTFIKTCKTWYKGGLFRLPFDILKEKQNK